MRELCDDRDYFHLSLKERVQQTIATNQRPLKNLAQDIFNQWDFNYMDFDVVFMIFVITFSYCAAYYNLSCDFLAFDFVQAHHVDHSINLG